MNTNHLKKFAQGARRKLLNQVETKLDYVLNTDSAELREKASQLRELRRELERSTQAQLIDKVAYTWFNRFMALRFMDANDYQPVGIRVLTPKDGYTQPELLDEAKQGHIPDDLPVNKQHIFDLLDGKINSSNPQNEAYKELLIGACNHLNKVFPFLFERIDDFSELLMPDDLISEFSIVQDIRDGMTSEDCQEVEIIGWLYQFYISEKKDEVFASKSKVVKEDIPAATQLFTPRWIVEYMVQNTVGKLWLQNRPHSKLREHMPYFIESPSVRSENYLKVNSVEEITLLDQACGSGHILVYGFELLTRIYEEEGYNSSEIPQLIIENNLYGFEIDDRAAQLAGLALMMKARHYQRRVFRKKLTPNILCYSDLNLTTEEIKQTFAEISISLSGELLHDLTNMQQATNLGSLIAPQCKTEYLTKVLTELSSENNLGDIFFTPKLESIEESIKQLILLSKNYHCIVDNPPYMGGGKMNSVLAEFVKKEYPDEKADLMVCFMQKAITQLVENGLLGMINLPSWMFLSSFENYRNKMLKSIKIETLLHLGRGIFGSDFGTVAFTFSKAEEIEEKGVYRRLFKEHVQVRSVKKIENLFLDKSYGFYTASQKDFEKIPGSPIGYWLSEKMINAYKLQQLNQFAEPRQGLATGDNNQFLRFWQEISICKSPLSNYSAKWLGSKNKWFGCNKGGIFRKWYGNNYFVVDWEKDGRNIKEDKLKRLNEGRILKSNSKPKNTQYYFKEGLTWSTLSSSKASFRYTPKGFMFETKGSMIFAKERNELLYICGFLNSHLVNAFLKATCPTLDYHEGPIGRLPYKPVKLEFSRIIINKCISISELEWDSRDTSWDFRQSELLRFIGQDLEESYYLYQQFWKNKFFQLHKNEEELNQQFIEIYALQEELTPDVPLKDITILKEELDQKELKKMSDNYKSGWVLKNGEWSLQPVTHNPQPELPFNAKEVFAQFMSYSVGCMLGRYSLDKEGLILANQGETLEDYLQKINLAEDALSFLPDDDNIIPVLNDEWFEDDIVGRFFEFLKVSFGKENFDKNLNFVEECLGKNIRKYFLKDFYSDHIKRYKKRPIYWMFSSPKGSFNVLIYMHRYTPDTLNNILNNYLREYQEKLRTRSEHLDHIIETGTTPEQNKARREQDKLRITLLELKEYERDILYPLATERIHIDLDDGVLVNYNKFGESIKRVSGLNDKKAKAKVKNFDWIDTGQIR